MECPDCKRLRHNGPCEPVFDEPDELELLRMDAAMARERFEEALKEKDHERSR